MNTDTMTTEFRLGMARYYLSHVNTKGRMGAHISNTLRWIQNTELDLEADGPTSRTVPGDIVMAVEYIKDALASTSSVKTITQLLLAHDELVKARQLVGKVA